MAEPAADGSLPCIPPDTTLSDRDLIIHTLQHVESIDDRLAGFQAILDELGPLIEKAKKYGGGGSRLFGGRQAPGGSPG